MSSLITSLNLQRPALIEASAGTGKTYTITFLVLRLLLGVGGGGTPRAPLEPAQILVVTFTNAATAELRARIHDRLVTAIRSLEQRACDPQWRDPEPAMQEIIEELAGHGPQLLRRAIRILSRARRTLDTAPICTIHSFCYQALGQVYAFEAAEAFSVEYVSDLSTLYGEETRDVVRELFYTHATRAGTLEALGRYAAPQQLQKLITDLLMRVRLPVPAAEAEKSYALHGLSCTSPALAVEDRIRELASQLEGEYAERMRGLNTVLEDFRASEAAARLDELAVAEGDGLVPGPAYHFIGKRAEFSKNAQRVLADCRRALACTTGHELLDCGLFTISEDKLPGRLLSRVRKYEGRVEQAGHLESLERQMLDLARAVQAGRGGTGGAAQQRGRELAVLLGCRVVERVEARLAREHLISHDGVILRFCSILRQQGPQGGLARMVASRYRVAIIDEFQDTDPVQFEIFRTLYLSPEQVQFRDEAGPASCCLIGDPRQSIYAFRGSDINAYLQARSLVAGAGRGTVHSLSDNYRSAAPLIAAINAMFGTQLNPGNTAPFADPQIPYAAVTARSRAAHFELSAAGGGAEGSQAAAAFTIITGVEHEKRQGARRACAAACASGIARTLHSGWLRAADGSRRRVRPTDITVLVRSSSESTAVSAALAALNIPSVYASDRSSVLHAPNDRGEQTVVRAEARCISYLMAAMCAPRSRPAVLRLLGCGLLLLNGSEFRAQMEDAALEREIVLLEECAALWQRQGFMPAFLRYMHAHAALERLLAAPGGRRELINCLHICELLQSRHGGYRNPSAQYRDYLHSLDEPGSGYVEDQVRTRLSSQREQVRIMTIHKSKGLEFPLVFLPFVFMKPPGHESGHKGLTLFYDELSRRRELDVAGDEECSTLSRKQDEHEQRRLLYVALTRACSALFMYAPACGEFGGCLSDLLGTRTAPELQTLCDAHPALFVCKQVTPEQLQETPRWREQRPHMRRELSQLPEGAIDRSFAIASFSSLVAAQHARSPQVQEDEDEAGELTLAGERPDETPPPAAEASAGPDPFSFPRGTQPGDFLHRLLEHLDFTRCHDPEYLRSVANEAVREPLISGYAFAGWCRDAGRAVEVLGQWLHDITHAVIHAEGGQQWCLADLAAGDSVAEMRFLMPSDGLELGAINALCRRHALHVCDARGDERRRAHLERLTLGERQLRGYLTGSVDLVLRLRIGGERRYFVIDYKSTHLGDSHACYAPAGLQDNIFSPRCRYDLQYMIYSLALYRHLRSRLAGFDYERHVGGVIYLYLRGLRAGSSATGVFSTRLSAAEMVELDRLCRGTDTPEDAA